MEKDYKIAQKSIFLEFCKWLISGAKRWSLRWELLIEPVNLEAFKKKEFSLRFPVNNL